MWHGNWLKLSEEFANVINCGKHQHNVVADLKNSLWTFLTGIDKGHLRIHGLNPFLFGEPYSSSLLTGWAKEANLLPIQGVIQDGVADKHTKQAVLLVDTVIYHATLALHMLTVAASTCDVMRERFLQYQKICGELNQCLKLDDAMKCVARDELYHIVQKHASEGLLDKKMGAAAFLISYKLFDNMLETAETNVMIKEFQDEWNVDAKKWKEMGNEEYKDGQYLRAVANYTMAVKTNRYSAVLYGNRAQAYLKLGKLDEAELDGRRAVVLKPRWCKGYLRLAQAVEGQNRLHEAHCIASYGIKSCDEIPFFKDTLRIVEEKAVKKCKNEGYCSKKTKKISGHNEKIKSTQHIDNTVNDLADSNMENHWPSDVPELTDSDSNSDYSNDIACDAIEEYGDTSIEKFKNLLGLGSEHFIAGRYQCAVDCFETTLGEINSSLDMYSKLEIEPIRLTYALGISYVAAGSSENIQKAIVLFTKHLKDSDIEKFPAIYYGLGWAYVKLNRFKKAEDPLLKCLQILKPKTSLFNYMWPGSTHIIEETQKERLEVVIQELFEICSNPPEPDAVCRYHLCKLDKKVYYSDPDFKGLCLVRCHDQCSVEYHPGCWKLLKESLKLTDKEFLGQNCLTPDCNSTIVLVKIEDKYRIVVKEFEGDNIQKNKSLQKHRKNKLEKKFEQKERRKRKRQENHHSSKQISEHAERNACHSEQEGVETGENNIQESCLVETKEERNESFQEGLLENNKNKESLSTQLTYTTNSVPVCILKKSEVDVPLKDQKAKKQKERKKQKSKNIMSIEEFCDGTEEFSVFNEYQQRLKRLEENKRMIEEGDENWVDFCEKNEHIPQLDPSRPFYIDKSLRENTVALDAILQLCGGVGETEEIRSMRESVYSYMEDFLHSKGPVHKNDDILLNEIKCFSPETQNLIVQSGGLEKFLLNSMNFAVANDYICLFSDVVTVYSLPAYEKPATYLDSLDTFDDFQQYDKTNNLDSENDTLLDPTISTLNPHASEYNPVQQITDCSNRYLVEDVGKEFLENMNLSKNVTISDYSKETLLVQNKCDKNEDKETEKMQYVKDENSSINKEGFSLDNNHFICASQNCNNYENGEPSKTTNLVQNNDCRSFDSHSVENNNHVLYKEMPYQQLIEIVASMLNRLSDYKVCQERTADILNKKLNCFQITLLGAKGKAAFPTELNYAELQKRIACLEDDKEEIEQRLVENLDTITQLKKKHSLEITTLETSLEDSISVQKKLEKELDELIMLHDNKSRQGQQERTKLQEENKTLKEDLASVSQELENLTTNKNEMILQIEKLQSEVQTEIENKNELQKTIDSLYKKFEEHRTEKLVLSEQLAQLRKERSPPSIVPPNFQCFYPRGPLPASIPSSTFFPHPHPTPMRSHLDVLFPPRPNQATSGIFAATPPPGLEIPMRILPEYSPRNEKLQEQLLSPIPPISLPPVKQLCEATTSTETCEATSSFAKSYESISNFAKPIEPTSSYLTQSDSTNSLIFNSKEMSFCKSSATMDDETKKSNSLSDVSHLNHSDIAVASSSDSYHKPTPITIVNWNSSIRNGTDTKKATVGRLPPKLPSDSQKNSFEKLMSRLQNQFPTISRKDLSTSLKEYRAQHNNTLSGMTIDAIISGVSTMIKKKQRCPNNKCHVPNQTSNTSDQESVPAWTKRTAKMTPWNGKSTDCDSNCSICLEEMTPFVSFKVECGHSFHYRCIHEWVAKQSTCPICRIHVLLPDEFPILGQP